MFTDKIRVNMALSENRLLLGELRTNGPLVRNIDLHPDIMMLVASNYNSSSPCQDKAEQNFVHVQILLLQFLRHEDVMQLQQDNAWLYDFRPTENLLQYV